MKSPITAAIFAGGDSSRFGSAKANALIDGEEFIVRIARNLREMGVEEVLVVGGPQSDAEKIGARFVQDEIAKSGPFGALLSALHVCSSDVLLTMPCDVPFIDAQSCFEIANIDQAFDVRVATSKLPSTPQWLCSAWRMSCISHLENSFAKGERAIHRAVIGLNVEFVELNTEFLRNINTIEEMNN